MPRRTSIPRKSKYEVVPANRMPYAGLADAKDRADLIAYLQKTFK